MASAIALVLIAFCTFTFTSAQQQGSVVVCIAGQCIQGFSNLTLGAKLTASKAPTDVFLLPGEYTDTTNPQLLHDLLTSSSMTLTPSPGFENTSKSLPMSLSMQPGLAVYSDKLYAGQSGFSALSDSFVDSDKATPLSGHSLGLSQNVWVGVTTGANQTTVLWDSVPDVSQLPAALSGNSSFLSVQEMQSSLCSPPCSSSGFCTASASCACKPNFTGASCEQCATGFFGPNCTPCPSGCSSCDEGVSGSGRCLDDDQPKTSLATCNCLNGQCGNGGCTCSSGWTTGDNGTACAKCSDGFFLSSTGECQVCNLGCAKCSDTTGACLSCKPSFSLDATDKTKCNPPQNSDNTGAVCPEGSFSNGSGPCTPCDKACKSCSAGSSNDCVECAQGTYLFNGQCVSADGSGVCQTGQSSSPMIADNNKGLCDSCPGKCSSCQIPNFTRASTSNQIQCSDCLLGNFLSQGKCVGACPSGTFPDSDGKCQACDSSCASCAGKADFCLSCASPKLAFNGTCATSCPTGSSQSQTSSSCTACHPDCASCSGPAFNQCSTCPPSRPVLSNGRCLAICSKAEYFDAPSSSCKKCDGTCSSCSGSSSSECLACSSPNQVLRGGKCTDAPCVTDGSSTPVVTGLGACLNELVFVPKASGTASASPLPSITGLTNPTTPPPQAKAKLEWWQILLMALGCAFIFIIILLLWRRRQRRKRMWDTKVFARKRNLGQGWGWGRMKLGWLGMIGRARSRKVKLEGKETDFQLRDMKIRHSSDLDLERHGTSLPPSPRSPDREEEKMNIFDSYRRSVSSKWRSRVGRPEPSSTSRSSSHRVDAVNTNHRLSKNSVYSELTGVPRQMPEPRQPIRRQELLLNQLDRSATLSSIRTESTDHVQPARHDSEPLISIASSPEEWSAPPMPPFALPVRPSSPSPAEEYARIVKPALASPSPLPGNVPFLRTWTPEPISFPTAYAQDERVVAQTTGGTYVSKSSNNPFR